SGRASDGSALSSFAVGKKETGTNVGTWRDAEDGSLSRNAVAQGSIDTVAELEVKVPAFGSTTVTFWIAAGQNYDEVRLLDQLVRDRGPLSFLKRTEDYWRL